MNLVTLQNATVHIGERTLLDEVSLLINDGDRIGLIGPNGSGKTTLLRMITGHEPAAASLFGAMYASNSCPKTPSSTPTSLSSKLSFRAMRRK